MVEKWKNGRFHFFDTDPDLVEGQGCNIQNELFSLSCIIDITKSVGNLMHYATLCRNGFSYAKKSIISQTS
jgi:hypothetical protein